MGTITPENIAISRWIQEHPNAVYTDYRLEHPDTPLSYQQFGRRKYEALKRRPEVYRGHGTGVEADFESNKKIGEFDWREWCDLIEHHQTLSRKASSSQDFATIKFPAATEPICIMPFGDTHIGASGIDIGAFRRITDEILNTPNLYVILMGDIAEMAIKLRGVAEVTSQILKPGEQMMFVDKWVEMLAKAGKLLAGVWCNHAVTREENQVGYSRMAEILSRHGIYFPHIGHVDIQVGEHVYKLALSHKFMGNSIYSRCAGQKRYLRDNAPDRDIVLMADTHVPAIEQFYVGPYPKLAITSGTLHTESSYGKRYFSLFTQTQYPVVTLSPHKKEFRGYWSLQEWANDVGMGTEEMAS